MRNISDKVIDDKILFPQVSITLAKISDLMISKGYLYFARIWRTDDLFLLPEMIS